MASMRFYTRVPFSFWTGLGGILVIPIVLFVLWELCLDTPRANREWDKRMTIEREIEQTQQAVKDSHKTSFIVKTANGKYVIYSIPDSLIHEFKREFPKAWAEVGDGTNKQHSKYKTLCSDACDFSTGTHIDVK